MHLIQKEVRSFITRKALALADLLSFILHMDEFTYIVAMEKWLSVWHDPSGTDNKITAKCLAIGQLNVNGPGSFEKEELLKEWKGTGEKKEEENEQLEDKSEQQI